MAFLDPSSPMVTASEAIYALARLLKALGVQTEQKTFDGKPDYRVMADQAMRRIEDLMVAASEAQKQWLELRAQFDEAQAAISATAQDGEYERSRARMRLLEVVLRAEISGNRPALSNMMPEYTFLISGPPVPGAGLTDVRKALLADLDALVALGLKGEVGA